MKLLAAFTKGSLNRAPRLVALSRIELHEAAIMMVRYSRTILLRQSRRKPEGKCSHTELDFFSSPVAAFGQKRVFSA